MQTSRVSGVRRTAIAVGMAALISILGGCAYYEGSYYDGGPGHGGRGYYGGHGHGYGYGGYERYEWRDRGRHW